MRAFLNEILKNFAEVGCSTGASAKKPVVLGVARKKKSHMGGVGKGGQFRVEEAFSTYHIG